VYDYSAAGISRHEDGWQQILTVLTMPMHNSSITSVWDAKLQEYCAYDSWHTQL
jgi:hypothetical protein